MGVCGKNVGNMQKLHTKLSPSYPQVIPKMWITECKLYRHPEAASDICCMAGLLEKITELLDFMGVCIYN